MGLPHSAPVQSDKKQNTAPVGARAWVIMPETRVLKLRPSQAQKAMAT